MRRTLPKLRRNPALAALCFAALFVSLFIKAALADDALRSAVAVHEYVFLGLERQRIYDPAFLQTKALEGAQVKYTWRTLEPEKDKYDFSRIRSDLTFLSAHGKKLFVQLQDVTFDPVTVNVPPYLQKEQQYHGGADQQYEISGSNEQTAAPAGWVARRWDPAVRERFQKLLAALGAEFDGKIAGINIPETAVDFGETGKWYPKGFDPAGYRDAILSDMAALKKAFPKSVTMQYANFMPGEWLPWTDHGYLSSVYESARELGVGVGGPDLLPYRKGQMSHCYHFLPECSGIVPTGIAVQDGNYNYKNPKNGKMMTVSELFGFATGTLHVDYIFWCTQEPYYTRDVLPFLKTVRITSPPTHSSEAERGSDFNSDSPLRFGEGLEER